MAAARAPIEPLQRRVSELSTCPICFEVLQKAKSLPCFHTFCLQCLKDYWKDKRGGQRVSCPVCRQPFHIPRDGLDSLPVNFFVQNLIEISGASTDSSEGIPCEDHPDKRLELYCLNCKLMICRKCQAASHRRHDSKEVAVVAEEFAKSLEEATGPVQLRIEEFQTAVDQHETGDWQFHVAVKAADVAAKQHGEKIKNTVDGQVGDLLNKLQEMKIEEQKEAKSRKAALELAISEMKSFVSSSLDLRTKGSPCDVIISANDLRARASQLLETYVIPADQVSPILTFVPLNIDKLTSGGQNLVGRLRRLSGPGKSVNYHIIAWSHADYLL